MSETILATGLEFPEGPVCDRDGAVYVVEIRGGRVRKIAADGTMSVFAQPGGGPNGAARGPDGALYITNNGGFAWHDDLPIGPAPDYETGRIERIDVHGGLGAIVDVIRMLEHVEREDRAPAGERRRMIGGPLVEQALVAR